MATCPLTGVTVDIHQPGSTMEFSYETPSTGPVLFTDIALMGAAQLDPEQKQILAGICRNRQIKGESPSLITASLLRQLYDQAIPYSFEERARHLLQYLYENGGKQCQPFNLNSPRDSPITYSAPEEFDRIIRFLQQEGWVTTEHITATFQGTIYQGLRMTKSGIQEIEKGLPKMPMFGLVDQKITTGDSACDSAIEHARRLFFSPAASLEAKRSACEALAYLLEPLRKELEGMFQGDTDIFFQLVNTFNVRHNKVTTKKIEHPEQLEWIFYSLLNTLNTYVKMKKKLS